MRVLHVQYTNPGAYPPLVRGAQLLAESGAEVRMLGTRVRGLDALTLKPTSGLTVRLAEEASDGWRLKAHYARYAAWVARETASWSPDWIYASDLLSAPIALGLRTLTRAGVVYHEHDAPSHARPSWLIQRCLDARRRLVRAADVVVAPNAERGALLSALAGGRAVHTVWNCPRRPTRRPPMSQRSDRLRLIFRGSVNAERLPMSLIDALALLPPCVELEVAGYETGGSRGYLAALASRADALGIGARIRMLGTLSDGELAPVCESSDVGLALMPMQSDDDNMRHMAGASNKVFEYLSHGVAPLVSDLPDWRSTFVDPGYALACDPSDVRSIAGTLGLALKNRDALRAVAERGYERLCADWNYESQFAPVLEAMTARPASTFRRAALEDRQEAQCAF
jgi:glycosyltransferase involved in cell wall biosynthesis